jgi:hypothetical protein
MVEKRRAEQICEDRDNWASHAARCHLDSKKTLPRASVCAGYYAAVKTAYTFDGSELCVPKTKASELTRRAAGCGSGRQHAEIRHGRKRTFLRRRLKCAPPPQLCSQKLLSANSLPFHQSSFPVPNAKLRAPDWH